LRRSYQRYVVNKNHLFDAIGGQAFSCLSAVWRNFVRSDNALALECDLVRETQIASASSVRTLLVLYRHKQRSIMLMTNRCTE
jgi:hypothetical protein